MPYYGRWRHCGGVDGDIFQSSTIKMASNFDRATIFNFECPQQQTAYMTEEAFTSFVKEHAQDLGDDARDVVRRCYNDISPFDVARPEAYEQARTCALGQIRARHSRARVLSNATRSVAPSYRGALTASMHDRRAGAEGDDDGMD